MKYDVNDMEQKFSNELKLLIFLSQDDLNTATFQGKLNGIDWKVFLDLTLKHRLVSHILKHSEFLTKEIPPSVYQKLVDYRLAHSRKALNYAVHAIRIYQQFTANTISHCFFKGPLLSLELYHDIGYRNFGDIDILVDKKDVEKAKTILEELDFRCIYPKIKLTAKQKKINYSISHHYHFVHPVQSIDIELHWSITNPQSYFGVETKEILSNTRKLKVSNYELPYLSKIENLVYQAAHGSIHQWYRLFWLKDFSRLITLATPHEIKEAYQLSKKLKLNHSFIQACKLSNLIYKTDLPDAIDLKINRNLIRIPLHSIHSTDLNQRGIKGKIGSIFYRLKLKPSLNYYWDLIFRLRTHLTDWELIRLPNFLFFLYYVLRPFLLIYKFLIKR